MSIELVRSSDDSYTAYSDIYNEHYHSTKDGALNETLQKHVIPALTFHQNSSTLKILDICFGLGYNTLATLYTLKNSNKNIKIISPELDLELVNSLNNFDYPKEFDELKDIIYQLSTKKYYKKDNIEIEVIIGDAREYLSSCFEEFNIIYHDAFSIANNPSLWTYEYFKEISRVMSNDGILTTYSSATTARMGMHLNSLHIYENQNDTVRTGTLAFKRKQDNYKYIDMILKQSRNKEAKAIYD